MVRRCVWILALLACGGGGAARTDKTKTSPFGDHRGPKDPVIDDDDGASGCKIKVDESGFFVGSQRIDVRKSRGGGPAVAQLRLADGTTLVADRDGETLWWIDCAQEPHARRVVSSKDAAVLTGELDPDATAFVFQDGNRIRALDLESRELRTVYKTKQDTSTCKAHKKTQTLVPEDSFRGFAEDGRHIVLHRSMLCQAPDTHEVRLVKWEDAERISEHPAHVVYAVSADGKGNLWMADGGGLWRSTDGDTWRPVATPAGGGAPVQVFADATRPNLVVIRTSVAPGVVQGTSAASFPGQLLRTKDGGKTWARIKPPDDKPVAEVHAIDGNADELVIPGLLSPDDAEDEDADDAEKPAPSLVAKVKDGARAFPKRDAAPPAAPPRSWIRTVDGGAKWTKTSAPDRAPKPAVAGEDSYEATRDGLWRTRNDLRRKVTKTLDRPYPRDMF
ncbi:MAG: hypothetical protein KIT31_14540 [Deltaproteobacteria bacterium]|nr:hypothetical protein [Deltaproteobacteria bacterium]